MRIQFDSLLMPDGATVPIQAAATDLELRPLKGKVEGKNTGKNVLVRSLSGIGQAGAILVGRGSLNQPLSESDLLRERVSNNIGEASDEQISRMAILGATAENKPLLEESYLRVLAAFEPHVGMTRYLFGSRPSLADFAWFGQLSEMATDPTPMRIMRKLAPFTDHWVRRLDEQRRAGRLVQREKGPGQAERAAGPRPPGAGGRR